MIARAKFVCNSVKPYGDDAKVIRLQAVLDVLDDSPENKEFWKYTPSGWITITISNPRAFSIFHPGKSYYVDFSEVV